MSFKLCVILRSRLLRDCVRVLKEDISAAPLSASERQGSQSDTKTARLDVTHGTSFYADYSPVIDRHFDRFHVVNRV